MIIKRFAVYQQTATLKNGSYIEYLNYTLENKRPTYPYFAIGTCIGTIDDIEKVADEILIKLENALYSKNWG